MVRCRVKMLKESRLPEPGVWLGLSTKRPRSAGPCLSEDFSNRLENKEKVKRVFAVRGIGDARKKQAGIKRVL